MTSRIMLLSLALFALFALATCITEDPKREITSDSIDDSKRTRRWFGYGLGYGRYGLGYGGYGLGYGGYGLGYGGYGLGYGGYWKRDADIKETETIPIIKRWGNNNNNNNNNGGGANNNNNNNNKRDFEDVEIIDVDKRLEDDKQRTVKSYSSKRDFYSRDAKIEKRWASNNNNNNNNNGGYANNNNNNNNKRDLKEAIDVEKRLDEETVEPESFKKSVYSRDSKIEKRWGSNNNNNNNNGGYGANNNNNNNNKRDLKETIDVEKRLEETVAPESFKRSVYSRDIDVEKRLDEETVAPESFKRSVYSRDSKIEKRWPSNNNNNNNNNGGYANNNNNNNNNKREIKERDYVNVRSTDEVTLPIVKRYYGANNNNNNNNNGGYANNNNNNNNNKRDLEEKHH